MLTDSKKSIPNTSSSAINMTNIDEKEELQSVTMIQNGAVPQAAQMSPSPLSPAAKANVACRAAREAFGSL